MTSDVASAAPENRILRNTACNFLGMAVPITVALVCIPQLIERLGAPRFGVLTLVWLIVIYFGQFNFGLGRATAKFAAQELADGASLAGLAELVRSSLVVHLLLGLVGAACLAAATPWLVGSVLNVPAELHVETASVLYLLVPTIPLILLSDCLRGVLEAHHRFGFIAAVQAPASALTYLGPLLVLPFSENLAAVVALTVVTRLAVFTVYAIACARLVSDVAASWSVRWSLVRRMLGFGGWVTVSALAAPILAALDRFTIGAVVSLSAVAWYATPFEVVSKLWLFSGSFLAVLFPIFTALGRSDRTALPPLYNRSVTMLTAVVLPPALLLILVGPELLRLWVGEEFATHGAPVVRLLAIGIAVNVVAQVPFTLLQSVELARVPALLQLLQIPCYAALVWWSASNYGAAGVAAAWALRAVVEAGVLFVAADRLVLRPAATVSSLPSLVRPALAGVALAAWSLCGSLLPESTARLFACAALAVVVALIAEWAYLLTAADRESVLRRFKSLQTRRRGAI